MKQGGNKCQHVEREFPDCGIRDRLFLKEINGHEQHGVLIRTKSSRECNLGS